MFRVKLKYLFAAIFITLAIAALVWTRSYLFTNMGASLQKRIQSLNLSGFNVRYDSISVDWIGNVILIDNLLLEKNAYDTTCVYPEFISAGSVRAEGIGLFQLIFRKKLSIKSVRLERLRVMLREHSLMQLDSITQRENEFSLEVDDLSIRSAGLTYVDSAHCKTIATINSHIAVSSLELDFHIDKPFRYKADILTFDSAEVDLPRQLYTFKVLKVQMDFPEAAFRVDSARVIPQLSNVEFGRKVGYEIDRFDAVIPYVKISELDFAFTDTLNLKAGLAEIQFYLKVFRDKRLPFVTTQKLLPVAMLQNLPFNLVIDSLKVTKSYVQYEEVVEGMTEPGKVFFDNLYAVLLNVDNTTRSGNTQLSAHAKLQGHGDLNVFVTFPLDENKRSTLKGSIRNFRLPEINSMLTPSTQVKVESGNMKEMTFDFTFNAIRSEGEIELNYEDLKVVSFKDEAKQKGEEPQKDNLKTFIMNTFIFRKNMDEDVPEDKRTGAVQYVRDDARSIFNFWVKSLISGLKSAYNLDKTEARKTDKEIKQERRNERKESRRGKRSEKKKDRG